MSQLSLNIFDVGPKSLSSFGSIEAPQRQQNQALIKQTNQVSLCFVVFLMFFMVFWGFILFQNGYLRSPDLLQYFLNDFGNFESFVKIWTRGPPNYYQNASANTRNYGSILENIMFVNLGLIKKSKHVCPRYHISFDRCFVLSVSFFNLFIISYENWITQFEHNFVKMRIEK